MRASETSSGQGTPGDQALCSCCPGVVLKAIYLNLAILGRTPELHICSNIKAQSKITGRCSTQARPPGWRWQTGHRAARPAGLAREFFSMILRGVLAAQLTPPHPGRTPP